MEEEELTLGYSWGYGGTQVHCLDDDTIIYVDGNLVKTINSTTGMQTVLGGSGAGISCLAINRAQSLFAYAEKGLKPSVFLHRYPRKDFVSVLPEAAELELLDMNFSKDGSRVITLGGLPDFSVVLWDWSNYEEAEEAIALVRTTVSAHTCKHVSFNPMNGDMFCVGGGGVLFFGLVEKEFDDYHVALTPAKLIGDDVGGADFGPHVWGASGEVYCVSSDVLLKFDGTNGMCLGDVFPDGLPSPLVCLLVTRAHLVVAGQDGVVRWISLADQQEVYRVDTEKESVVTSLTYSPSYCILYGGLKNGMLFKIWFYAPIPKVAKFFDEAGDGSLSSRSQQLTVPSSGSHELIQLADFHRGRVTGLDVSSQEPVLASVGVDGTLRLWDYTTRRLLTKCLFSEEICCVSFHPSKDLLLLGTENGTVRVIDVTNPGNPIQLHKLKLFHDRLTHVAWDPTGESAVCASWLDPKIFFITLRIDHTKAWVLRVAGYITLRSPLASCSYVALEEGDKKLLLLCTDGHLCCLSLAATLPVPATNFTLDLDDFGAGVCDLGLKRCTHISAGPINEADQLVVLVSTEDKLMGLYTLPNKMVGLKQTVDPPQLLTSDGEPVVAWEKAGQGIMHLSPDARWVAIGGPDGNLSLRPFPGITQLYRSSRRSDALTGGLTSVAWSADSSYVFTGSADGSVAFWQVYKEEDEEAIPEHFPSSYHTADLDNVAAGREFGLASEVEDHAEPVLTFLESQLKDKGEVADAVHTAIKNTTRAKLAKMKKRLGDLLVLNEKVDEIAKLKREEFVIDFDTERELKAEGEKIVQQVREAIKFENLARDLVRHRVMTEMWDHMATHGVRIQAFQSGIDVANYPVKVLGAQEVRELEMIKGVREIEVAASKRTKEMGKERLVEVEKREGEEGEEEREEEEEDAEPEISDGQDLSERLLYHPYEVGASDRKRSQIVLLGGVVNALKTKFNADFAACLERKKGILSKIQEKNARISEITKELCTIEDLYQPTLADTEVADRILQVDDQEVGVEKFVSEAELKKIEDEKKRALEKSMTQKDNFSDRALKQMMNNTLETDEQKSKLQIEMVRPEWMLNPPPEGFTDEQQKAIKDFEAAERSLKDEQDKHRKALESEMKKLKGDITVLCQQFDESLQELFDARLKIDQKVYEQELYGIKLSQSLLQAEEDWSRMEQLRKELDELKMKRSTKASALGEFQRTVANFRELFEDLQKEDRDLDKHFKREFADQEQHVDILYRLFKRRNRVAKPEVEAPNEDELNPYYEADIPAQSDAIEPLTDADRPEDITDDSVWTRLLEARQQKIDFEIDAKKRQLALNEMTKCVERLTEEDKAWEARITEIMEEIRELGSLRERDSADLDIIFKLKQGQIEVEQAAVVTDYSDSVLVDRTVVEVVNQHILQLGSEKMVILNEIKDFRKGIHRLQWDNRRLDLEEENVLQKTRDLQLLRVTKNLQELLKDGGDNTKQAMETAMLEKRLDLKSRAHQDKVEDMVRAITRLQRQVKEMQRENFELDDDVNQLESAVSERAKLFELQREQGEQSEDIAANDKARMRDLVTYRKMIDLARAQTSEIEAMREELVRLRARTFPSFAQLQDQRGNPDQR